MWLFHLLLACKPPCEDLSEADCLAREDCGVTQAKDWCTNELQYGGCMAVDEPEWPCGDAFTVSYVYDGVCRIYSHGCWPEGLEQCQSECAPQYDTGR